MIVQNVDINAGKGHYKHLKSDQLLVTKVFHTIQGEGPYAGRPAVFIRLAGCTRGSKLGMGCDFCDTNFFFHKGVVKTFEELLGEIRIHDNTSLVVITGGEPFVQPNTGAFIQYLFERQNDEVGVGVDVQVETNGDCHPAGLEGVWGIHKTFLSPRFMVVVSPKYSSNVSQDLWLLRKEYLENSENVVLKFLVSADISSPYYYLPQRHQDCAAAGIRIYLSPLTDYRRGVREGEVASFWNSDLIDYVSTQLNYRRAVKLVQDYNYQLSLQTHLLLEVE